MVFRLIYRSRSLIPADRAKGHLGEIFSVSRSNNKRQDITGALLIADGCFVQALEGDEQQVQRLFDDISADDRHTDVTLVDERRTKKRTFGEWSMARVGDAQSDIPLAVNQDNDAIRPRSAPSVSGDQQMVLDYMADTARADW